MVELKKLFEILWFIDGGPCAPLTMAFWAQETSSVPLRRFSTWSIIGQLESRSGKLFCQQEEKSEHSICYSWVSFHVRKNYKLILCCGFFYLFMIHAEVSGVHHPPAGTLAHVNGIFCCDWLSVSKPPVCFWRLATSVVDPHRCQGGSGSSIF